MILEGPESRMHRTRHIIVFTGLVLCVALLIPYRMLINTSITAPLELVREFFASGVSDSDLKARSKNTPIQNLKEMLFSSDPNIRGFAAKMLGYKDDPSA